MGFGGIDNVYVLPAMNPTATLTTLAKGRMMAAVAAVSVPSPHRTIALTRWEKKQKELQPVNGAVLSTVQGRSTGGWNIAGQNPS